MSLHFRTLAVVVSVAAVLSLARVAGVASTQQHSDTEDREFKAMSWSAGTQKLSQSHGTFAVPSGGRMVVGSQAQRADELINGTGSSDTEGVVELLHRTLYLSYSDSGFVTADDWKNIDAAKMLKDMSEADEASNDERVKNGADAIHVNGWVQRPTFDAARKSARWVVSLRSDRGTFVNAVALQLGRQGYERFTLASNGSDPQGDAAILAGAVKDYQFNRGFRFSDYVQGDKLAGYGIAALVGTAAGATIAKTVGFGVILLLIKKFFVLILAGLAGGFGFLKRMFRGNRLEVGPPKTALTDSSEH